MAKPRRSVATTTTTEVEVLGGWENQILHLPGNPVVAPRPRVSRWGTYYPAKYKAWMQYADEAIPQQDHTRPAHVRVELAFVVSKARTSKLTRPTGDIDNYMKAILDALTKKQFWKDDVDIVEVSATKRFTREGEEPHTTVVIYRSEP